MESRVRSRGLEEAIFRGNDFCKYSRSHFQWRLEELREAKIYIYLQAPREGKRHEGWTFHACPDRMGRGLDEISCRLKLTVSA